MSIASVMLSSHLILRLPLLLLPLIFSSIRDFLSLKFSLSIQVANSLSTLVSLSMYVCIAYIPTHVWPIMCICVCVCVCVYVYMYEMAGWHHRLDGHESEWALGDGDGQGGLACCNSWGRKESDTTERLNWTDVYMYTYVYIHVYIHTDETNKPLSHSVYITVIKLCSICNYSWPSNNARLRGISSISCRRKFSYNFIVSTLNLLDSANYDWVVL